MLHIKQRDWNFQFAVEKTRLINFLEVLDLPPSFCLIQEEEQLCVFLSNKSSRVKTINRTHENNLPRNPASQSYSSFGQHFTCVQSTWSSNKSLGFSVHLSATRVMCVSEQVTPLVTASVFSLRNSPRRTEANGGSCPQIHILSSLTSPNASAPPSYFLGEHSTWNSTDFV